MRILSFYELIIKESELNVHPEIKKIWKHDNCPNNQNQNYFSGTGVRNVSGY